ncbi:serine hydrolase domain-containing protein [Actinoplanes sp. NPDC024001]|uniref:serine hydrolase domain-containing protein n=1 Tax=Actinoplanes sp. NPDC024001 TaxID=3154598 RepID=UPI00340A0862
MLTHVITALLLAVPAAPARSVTTVDAASIDAVVRDYQKATRIPGVAVAVTQGHAVVHTAGFGRTASGDEVTDRTVMPIASLSKSITALAVMQLVEARRVQLDSPVSEYLPEFALADSRAAGITVRHLLEQTSGLADVTNPARSRPVPGTLREAVAAMRTARLAAEPGTRFEYHNPNYQVAARLVEVVSGHSFDAHLSERIFAPLGMTDSRTIGTPAEAPAAVRGHRMIAGLPVPLAEPADFGNGSGGVLSTAGDMAAWLIAQAAGYKRAVGSAETGGRGQVPGGAPAPGSTPRPGNTPTGGGAPTAGGMPPGSGAPTARGAPVLSPAGIAQMHRPGVRSDYGLGWDTGETPSGAPLVEHTGGLITATAYQALLPDQGYGIAVMANAGSQYGDAASLGAGLINLIEGQSGAGPDGVAALVATDIVILLVAFGAAVLAVRGVRRSGSWAGRHQVGRLVTVVRLLPYSLPLLLLIALDGVVSALYRGQDISWQQAAYLFPAFTLLLGVTSAGGVVVLGARLFKAATRQHGRSSGTGPARNQPEVTLS